QRRSDPFQPRSGFLSCPCRTHLQGRQTAALVPPNLRHGGSSEDIQKTCRRKRGAQGSPLRPFLPRSARRAGRRLRQCQAWLASNRPGLTEMTQIAIVTISDRASRGEYEDLGGPAIERWLRLVLAEPCAFVRRIVPDGLESVRDVLIELCDQAGVD